MHTPHEKENDQYNENLASQPDSRVTVAVVAATVSVATAPEKEDGGGSLERKYSLTKPSVNV